MCEGCREDNYQMGSSRFELVFSNQSREKDKLIYKQTLCKKCVLMNMDVTDLFFKFSNPNYPDYSEFEIKMRQNKTNKN
jgi:hypothetical protein